MVDLSIYDTLTSHSPIKKNQDDFPSTSVEGGSLKQGRLLEDTELDALTPFLVPCPSSLLGT